MEGLMEIALTAIPYELYTGRTVIQIMRGTPAVCRVSQVYPEIKVEQAANSATLTKDALAGGNGAPDGYYDCPLELIKRAESKTAFTLRDLCLLCAADWQMYARQKGGAVVKYRVVADGGIVDSTMDDPVAAIAL